MVIRLASLTDAQARVFVRPWAPLQTGDWIYVPRRMGGKYTHSPLARSQYYQVARSTDGKFLYVNEYDSYDYTFGRYYDSIRVLPNPPLTANNGQYSIRVTAARAMKEGNKFRAIKMHPWKDGSWRLSNGTCDGKGRACSCYYEIAPPRNP